MAELRAWYPLTQNLEDMSGNNRHLSLVSQSGDPVESRGALGRCLGKQSSGTTSYLQAPNFGLKGSHGMFAFLKVTELANSSTANGILGCHDHVDNSGTGITLKALSSTTFTLSVNTGYETGRTYHSYFNSNHVMQLDTWYHVGFTWDEDENRLCFYLNGEEIYNSIKTYDMYMLPSSKLAVFAWSIGHITSASYRPGFFIQDIRVYDGVPSKQEIKRTSKGLFFHLPLDAPIYGSAFTDIDWVAYGSYSTIQEQRHDYIRAIMVRDGTIALTPGNKTITSGNRYRISGYCFKNGQPVNAYNITSYSQSGRVKSNDSETGWFSFEFTATGTWVIHDNGGLGNPKIGDIMEFTDLKLESLTVEASDNMLIADASGMGHDVKTDIHCPSSNFDSAKGKFSAWFDENFLSSGPIELGAQSLTISAWIKGTAIGKGNYHQPININGTLAEISISAAGELRTGFVIDGSRRVFNSSSGLLDGNWHLVSAVFDGSTIIAYVDGALTGSLSAQGSPASEVSTVASGFLSRDPVNGNYASKDLNVSDLRAYGTALSADDILALHQERMSFNKEGEFSAFQFDEVSDLKSLTRSGVFNTSDLLENNYKPSLLDYSTWDIGATDAEGFNRNGASSETVIVTDNGPCGVNDVLWVASNNDTSSDADGGFNPTGPGYPFIDETKTYRLSVWVNRKVAGNGNFYFGCYGRNADEGGNYIENMSGSLNTNPYFTYGGLPVGEWLLCVSYIFPSGGSDNPSLPRGLFKENGDMWKAINVFRFAPGAKRLGLRSYLFYSTDPSTVQQWYRPRIDLVDGTEPTLEELLALSENTPLLPFYEGNSYANRKFEFGPSLQGSSFRELK